MISSRVTVTVDDTVVDTSTIKVAAGATQSITFNVTATN